MRKLLHILFSLVMLTSIASCNNTKSNSFHVAINIEKGIKADSVSLYVFDDEYSSLRKLGKEKLINGKALFTGYIDEAHLAYIQLDNDTTVQYFVLENEPQTYTRTTTNYKLSGGNINKEFFQVLLRHQNIHNQRKYYTQKYQKLLKDSTLTLEKEQALFKADSILSDSLQRWLVNEINSGKVYSRVIKVKFGNELSQENLKKLK